MQQGKQMGFRLKRILRVLIRIGVAFVRKLLSLCWFNFSSCLTAVQEMLWDGHWGRVFLLYLCFPQWNNTWMHDKSPLPSSYCWMFFPRIVLFFPHWCRVEPWPSWVLKELGSRTGPGGLPAPGNEGVVSFTQKSKLLCVSLRWTFAPGCIELDPQNNQHKLTDVSADAFLFFFLRLSQKDTSTPF